MRLLISFLLVGLLAGCKLYEHNEDHSNKADNGSVVNNQEGSNDDVRNTPGDSNDEDYSTISGTNVAAILKAVNMTFTDEELDAIAPKFK